MLKQFDLIEIVFYIDSFFFSFWQLLDELPMIYSTCIFVYCL